MTNDYLNEWLHHLEINKNAPGGRGNDFQVRELDRI